MYVEFFLLNKKGKGHFSVGRKSKDQTFRFDARELCLTHGSSFYRPGYLRLLNWTSTVWKDLDLHFFPSEMPWFFFLPSAVERGTRFRKGGVDSPLGQGGALSTSIFRWWSDLCLKRNTDGAEIQLNHLGNRVNSGIKYLSTGSSFWPATERNAKILTMYQKMFRISQESRSSPKDSSF